MLNDLSSLITWKKILGRTEIVLNFKIIFFYAVIMRLFNSFHAVVLNLKNSYVYLKDKTTHIQISKKVVDILIIKIFRPI